MSSKIKAILRFLFQLLRSLPLTTWLVLIALGLFAGSWIFGKHGLYELEKLIQMKKQLLKQQKELVEERESLEAEMKRLDDPLYIKHLIHKEMGFVERSEVIVKFPPKK